MIEHHQQLSLVGVQPLKQAVEGGEAGAASEACPRAAWLI
jgi:hypothetical protein